MNIKFTITKKELNKCNKDECLNILESFQNYMAMYEERMTFTEAERYWNKYEDLNEYIKNRFGISNPERAVHDRIFGNGRY